MSNQYSSKQIRYPFRGAEYTVNQLLAHPECKVDSMNVLKNRLYRNKIKEQGWSIEAIVTMDSETFKKESIAKRKRAGYKKKDEEKIYNFQPDIFGHPNGSN